MCGCRRPSGSRLESRPGRSPRGCGCTTRLRVHERSVPRWCKAWLEGRSRSGGRSQRDEEAIAVWKDEVRPAVKHRGGPERLHPLRRRGKPGAQTAEGRTWAPREARPVVTVPGKGSGRVNMAGVVAYRDGERSHLLTGCLTWTGLTLDTRQTHDRLPHRRRRISRDNAAGQSRSRWPHRGRLPSRRRSTWFSWPSTNSSTSLERSGRIAPGPTSFGTCPSAAAYPASAQSRSYSARPIRNAPGRWRSPPRPTDGCAPLQPAYVVRRHPRELAELLPPQPLHPPTADR